MNNPYRQLPSVDALLERPELAGAIADFGRSSTRDAARRLLDELRGAISQGADPPEPEWLLAELPVRMRRELAPSLIPVLNATGVVIHTNLGRAPLSAAARAAIVAAADGYSNLEYDLEAGGRGSRYVHAERLICELTGAEAALVVNNNAAAFTLLLRSVAFGREVILSRGELVEIGGGFRIPEVLHQSGAHLVEVGATNRTRLRDYEAALSANTAALVKIHQSNFRIIGFTEAVELDDLVSLARTHSLPVLNDLGSGTLLDTTAYGLTYEPTVQDSLRAGVSATTFSGDKLLGGPQAGIIVGEKALISRLRQEPLTRALRVDKTTLAALQATLQAYLRGTAAEEIPVWQMIGAQPDALAARAADWVKALAAAGIPAELRNGQSAIGGGSLPGQTLPTTLLAVPDDPPNRLAGLLRQGDPPVVARIEDNAVVFDPRTLLREQETALLGAIQNAWQRRG